MGTPRDFAVPGFDAVARLAAGSLRVSLVSLVLADGSAYWFTTDLGAMPYQGSLHPIYLEAARRNIAHVIPDADADTRFQHVPMLAGSATIAMRFFACEPVFTLSGHQVGALCVMDAMPRATLDDKERGALRDAAALAGAGVVLRSYLGRTDPVTQLPDRNAFVEDLRERQHGGARHVCLIAVEIAPASRFNAFIRAMGHAYADDLTRAVAARVQAWMPAQMNLYQVGTARFAAILPEHQHALIQPEQLDDLVARLRQPFDCLGIPLTTQPGVGLLNMDVGELQRSDPLRQVMSASFEAKHSARGWAIYDPAQDESHRQDFFLVTELAAALNEHKELELHYQPRVDLDSGLCVSVEALLRWQHPTLGAIAPDRFITLAENAGLMRSLTEWVFDQAIAQLAAWQREGIRVNLSMNVSNADLDADLVTRLEAVTSRHGVDPAALELEFTESTLMHHCVATDSHLAAIRALGTGIAIDDFGTGYSNLNSLRQIPATCLKIDRSFVRDIDTSRHDAAIVRSVVDLARDLNFRVVVEGIESQGVYDILLGMSCNEVQGFHIARPMPAQALATWLANFQPLPARNR